MCAQEYKSLINGNVLVNFKQHNKNGSRTSSIGFCFFKEDPDEAVHWLSGIADLDWCVTMEVEDKFLVKSWGLYLDEKNTDLSKPMNYEDFMRSAKFIRREEFCRCRYSNAQVRILSATDKYSTMYPPRSGNKPFIRAMIAGVKI